MSNQLPHLLCWVSEASLGSPGGWGADRCGLQLKMGQGEMKPPLAEERRGKWGGGEVGWLVDSSEAFI